MISNYLTLYRLDVYECCELDVRIDFHSLCASKLFSHLSFNILHTLLQF